SIGQPATSPVPVPRVPVGADTLFMPIANIFGLHAAHAETQTDVTPPTVQLPVPEAFGAQVTPTVIATTVLTPAASVEGDVEMAYAAGPSTSRPPRAAPTAALAVNRPEMKKKAGPATAAQTTGTERCYAR
ncbi:hypothetical protein Vretifemale_7916, partial [Volvox reticuliferus]